MIVLAAYLFYNSLWSCIFLSPVIPIYVVLRKKEAYGKKNAGGFIRVKYGLLD